jgi:hypothetical protein
LCRVAGCAAGPRVHCALHGPSRSSPAQAACSLRPPLRSAALLFYLDARITGTFEARRYELPARVYARPLELFRGAPLTCAALVARSSRLLGYRRVQRVRSPGDYELSAGNARRAVHSRGFDFPDGARTAGAWC